jgi:transcriptional regulator with XRE-family HTH domain
MRELRETAGLRQEELAVLFGVGLATVQRWERQGGTRPTGLPLQMYEMMDRLAAARVDLRDVRRILLDQGNVAAIRWILNSAYTQQRKKG